MNETDFPITHSAKDLFFRRGKKKLHKTIEYLSITSRKSMFHVEDIAGPLFEMLISICIIWVLEDPGFLFLLYWTTDNVSLK